MESKHRGKKNTHVVRVTQLFDVHMDNIQKKLFPNGKLKKNFEMSSTKDASNVV